MVTEVTISVLVNELRALTWKHRGFQQYSIMVWRDAVKRRFITSGELGLSWHPCQVCGIRSGICVFVCVGFVRWIDAQAACRELCMYECVV